MTESGLPILANDIHIGLTMPSIWHAVGLHGGDFDVIGFTLPGVPGVITGHNADIAWGLTSLAPMPQDFYIERLDDTVQPTNTSTMANGSTWNTCRKHRGARQRPGCSGYLRHPTWPDHELHVLQEAHYCPPDGYALGAARQQHPVYLHPGKLNMSL
jgi:hypothetical protein